MPSLPGRRRVGLVAAAPFVARRIPIQHAVNPGASTTVLRAEDQARGFAATIATYLELMKLRLVALLVLVAVASAIASAGGWPDLTKLALLVIAGTLASSGAGALNHFIERDLDLRMERTRTRPLPSGRLEPEHARRFGLALLLLALIAALPLGPVTTVIIMAGAAIYVGVYTIWLKPTSPWSVVIGGLSGTCATLAGWSIGGSGGDGNLFTAAAFFSGLTLFLWSPPHFWCLALVRREEYRGAGFPTLAVVAGTAKTTFLIWSGFLLTVASALALGYSASAGPIFFIPTGLLGAALVAGALRLAARPVAGLARRLFGLSMTFMALSYIALALDAVLR